MVGVRSGAVVVLMFMSGVMRIMSAMRPMRRGMGRINRATRLCPLNRFDVRAHWIFPGSTKLDASCGSIVVTRPAFERICWIRSR